MVEQETQKEWKTMENRFYMGKVYTIRRYSYDWKYNLLVYLFESIRKKVIGKPYEGELHVRFDEGRLVKSKEETNLLLYRTK